MNSSRLLVYIDCFGRIIGSILILVGAIFFHPEVIRTHINWVTMDLPDVNGPCFTIGSLLFVLSVTIESCQYFGGSTTANAVGLFNIGGWIVYACGCYLRVDPVIEYFYKHGVIGIWTSTFLMFYGMVIISMGALIDICCADKRRVQLITTNPNDETNNTPPDVALATSVPGTTTLRGKLLMFISRTFGFLAYLMIAIAAGVLMFGKETSTLQHMKFFSSWYITGSVMLVVHAFAYTLGSICFRTRQQPDSGDFPSDSPNIEIGEDGVTVNNVNEQPDGGDAPKPTDEGIC